MGFFDRGGGDIERLDPLESFKKSFGGPLGSAIEELLRGIEQSRDPASSPLFALGKQSLAREGAVRNKQLLSTLSGRGTAFGGQRRTGARDVAGSQNRALMDLLLKAKSQGPQIASQLGNLLSRLAVPDRFTRKPSKLSGFEKLSQGVGLAARAAAAVGTGGASEVVGALASSAGGGLQSNALNRPLTAVDDFSQSFGGASLSRPLSAPSDFSRALGGASLSRPLTAIDDFSAGFDQDELLRRLGLI